MAPRHLALQLIKRDTQHIDTQHNESFVMLSDTNKPFMLSVVMLVVVAPFLFLWSKKRLHIKTILTKVNMGPVL